MRSKPMRVFLAFLIFSNFLNLPALAQLPAGTLRITIVEGEGAINNVRQRVNRDPIVQVEDENRRPVAGAAVTFFLPDQGSSGVFVNGQKSLTVTTDASGRATATGLTPNNTPGNLQIRVTASFGGRTASTVINSVNVAGVATGLSPTAKLLLILGIAGGAAVGGIVATRGGGSSTPGGGGPVTPPAIVLTPGTPTVGGPR